MRRRHTPGATAGGAGGTTPQPLLGASQERVGDAEERLLLACSALPIALQSRIKRRVDAGKLLLGSGVWHRASAACLEPGAVPRAEANVVCQGTVPRALWCCCCWRIGPGQVEAAQGAWKRRAGCVQNTGLNCPGRALARAGGSRRTVPPVCVLGMVLGSVCLPRNFYWS